MKDKDSKLLEEAYGQINEEDFSTESDHAYKTFMDMITQYGSENNKRGQIAKEILSISETSRKWIFEAAFNQGISEFH